MPNTLPRMKLSREEEAYLRRWIYDEAHFRDGPGPAKRLQLAHQAIPADLATIIAAAIPDPADQAAASTVAPTGLLVWPWTEHNFHDKLGEARAFLGLTAAGKTPGTAAP
jgi:hypothetical protein